ncbi:MAG: hypothetical protein U0166_13575 [Acidobacteriota bacterium]
MSRAWRGSCGGLAVALALVSGVAAAYLFAPVEYARIASPDGRWVAVATHLRYLGFLPMMPGGGGDKPGQVTIYRVADGRSVGSAPIELCWMLSDIRWEAGKAEIPLGRHVGPRPGHGRGRARALRPGLTTFIDSREARVDAERRDVEGRRTESSGNLPIVGSSRPPRCLPSTSPRA